MTQPASFKEITNINQNAATLQSFIKGLRRDAGWESSKGKENEVVFLFAFMVSLISLFIFGGTGHIFWFPLWLAIVWIAALLAYIAIRFVGDGDSIKEMDEAIDVLNKSMRRGKIGLQRDSATRFFLKGFFYNDLIQEEVTDYLVLSDKDVVKLYDLLDGMGNFPSNESTIELPRSIVEIPLNIK